MGISIRAIEYYLPETVVSNEQLAGEFPEWSVAKIEHKTGIIERHIAAPDECASDLAFHAARQLMEKSGVSRAEVDYILLCTQSPDYYLPTTACLLQNQLGIPQTVGALDFNLGCSGYIYGLGLAQGLIATGQASRLLLITADTYSKYINRQDKSVRTIFGDAAAATLLEASHQPNALLPSPFIYGTDGSGGEHLIVPAGGSRNPATEKTAVEADDSSGNLRSANNLFMNGAEVFNFTLRSVPDCIERLLAKANLRLDQIDLFVFHQANQYMLDHLRKKLQVPREKFSVCLSHCGNTVSSSIPIALHHAAANGQLRDGQLVMLVGFGVGYSWGATLLRWPMLGI